MLGLKAIFRLMFFCCLAFVDRPVEARVIKIAAGTNTISSALNIAATGDTLLLVSNGGSYHESSWVALKHASLTLMAAPDLDSPPIWTSDGDRHIRLYGNLTAKGIHFDGRNKADYAIKSDAPQPNNIWIENCIFSNIVKDAISDDDIYHLRRKRLETWGFNLGILLLAVGLIATLGYGVHRQTLRNERKRVENQIRQSQKLETLGHLTGGIAHDFNNLIAIIVGNAEIISESLPSVSRLRDNIEEVIKAASRS